MESHLLLLPMVNKVKFILVFILGAVSYLCIDIYQDAKETAGNTQVDTLSESEVVHSSPAIQMYFYIKKYSKKYGVPEDYAFGVAYNESRYRGPLHFSYRTKDLVSSTGALGPMQIIPRFAPHFVGRHLHKNELRDNIELNVMVSMKMLKKWRSISPNWETALGGYNTGHLAVNEYARSIIRKDYKRHWIKY
jgi:soluble lytic murein transglycosylase-like protein